MEVTLYSLLNRKRPQILSRWQSTAFSSYPHHEALSNSREANRFTSPVVYVIDQTTNSIMDWLLKANEEVDVFAPLEEICRLAAIQDTRPGEALKFIFSLKKVIRDVINDENETFYWSEELWKLDKRIDEMGLQAFNIYTDCRNKVSELKINEIKRTYGRVVG